MILQYVILTEGNTPKGYMPIIDLGLSGAIEPRWMLDKDFVLWIKWVIRTYPLSWITV